MADVEIKGKIVVDTGNTGQAVKGVKDNVKGLGDEVKKASGGSFSNLKQSLSGVGPAALDAAKGSGMLNTALNVLKANPIILAITTLVGIIVALIAKFSKMEGVSDALGKAWGSLSGVLNTFMTKILTPLIDGFVKLVELFTNGVLTVLDALGIASKKTGERMGELADEMDNLEEAERNHEETLAASNRKLQEAREIAADANVPLRDRIKALQDAAAEEKKQLDYVVEINRMKAKNLLEGIALEIGARENLIKVIKSGTVENLKLAKAEMMTYKEIDKERLFDIGKMLTEAENAGAASAKIGTKTSKQIAALEKEEADKRRADADARRKAESDAQIKQIEDENRRIEDAMKAHEIRKAQIREQAKQYQNKADKQSNLQVESTLRDTVANQISITGKLNQSEEDSARLRKQWGQMVAEGKQEELRLIGEAAMSLSNLAGENTAVGKALAVAGTTISTYQSAQLAYQSQFIPGVPDPSAPVRGAIAAGIAVANGLARLKQILKVQIPGKGLGASSSSIDGTTASAPLSPSPLGTRTSLNSSQLQAIGNAAKDGVYKAFVVESDIANNQERISRINRAARLG